MKTGRTIQEISQQILAEQEMKKDFIVNTPVLQMTPTEDGKDVEIGFLLQGTRRKFKPTPLCLQQIAERVGIPQKYADKMRKEAPQLLSTNVNHWFVSEPEKRMLRTLVNGTSTARAFLSERYRSLDNYDLANIVLPEIRNAGCEIRSCEITETRLYIQASTPRIQSVIDQNVVIGTHNRIKRTVEAGVIIGNSEIGHGSIFVDPMVYDLECTNGLILQRTLKRNHVGRRAEGTVFGDEDTFELFSDETRQLDDKAFWAKVNDVVKASMDEVKFRYNIARLQQAQGNILADGPTQIEQVIEITQKRLNLSDDEKGKMLVHFAQGGDYSQYGLINAITRTAEDAATYDRAVEMERMGGDVIEMSPSIFKP